MNITPASHPLDNQIAAILRAALPDLQAIYRYGSAGGVYQRPDSDLDLAVMAGHALTAGEKSALAAQLEPLARCEVDINDLRTLPLTLRVQIVMDGARLYAADKAAAEEYDSRTLSSYVRLNEERRGILDDIRKRGSIYG